MDYPKSQLLTRLDTPSEIETVVKLISKDSLQTFGYEITLVDFRARVSMPLHLTRRVLLFRTPHLDCEREGVSMNTRNSNTRLFTFVIFTTHNCDHTQ